MAGEPRTEMGSSLNFMRRRRMLNPTQHEGPMATMGNYLFDVALVLGVGLFIMALSSFGLSDVLSKHDMTIVKNPGKRNMTILTRKNGQVYTYTNTGQAASGQGDIVGKIYRLQDGKLIYVPGDAEQPQAQ